MKIKIADGIKFPQVVTETVDLSKADFSANYSLKGIKPFLLTVNFETFSDEVEVVMRAEIKLILECAYTLEHFEQVLDFHETLIFNFKNPDIELESDDVFYEKGPYIELDHYIFALILSYIPLKVIKPGAKLPGSGEGYDVYTEEQYAKQSKTVEDEYGDLFDELDIKDE